jgi:hypothetical protein
MISIWMNMTDYPTVHRWPWLILPILFRSVGCIAPRDFLIIWVSNRLWMYLMNMISDTHRVHLIWYIRFNYTHTHTIVIVIEPRLLCSTFRRHGSIFSNEHNWKTMKRSIACSSAVRMFQLYLKIWVKHITLDLSGGNDVFYFSGVD